MSPQTPLSGGPSRDSKDELPEPELTLVLGLPLHQLTLEQALEQALAAVNRKQPVYWVMPNMDFTAQAYQDEDLREILFHAHRSLCYGRSFVWLSRMIGSPLPERVSASDLLRRLFESTEKQPLKFFFMGCPSETVQRLKRALEAKFPKLEVCGSVPPPRQPIGEQDNRATCKLIRKAAPDILLVTLGCPQQERWMFAYHKEAGAALTIGVGASLDFMANREKPAPQWMQNYGLESLWHLCHHPWRDTWRYFKNLTFLIQIGGKQLWLTRRRRKQAKIRKTKIQSESPDRPQHTRIVWNGEISRSNASIVPMPNNWSRPIICDCRGVTFIDSSGLGLLAGLARKARESQISLILFRPSKVLVDLLETMKLDRQIPWVSSEATLIDYLKRDSESLMIEHTFPEFKSIHLKPLFALDLAQADAFVDRVLQSIRKAPRSWVLIVDMSSVDFIDSYGVAKLIMLKRQALREGISFWTEAHRPEVLRTLHFLRLEHLLIRK